MTDFATLHPAIPTIKTLSQSEWVTFLASITTMSAESRSKHASGPVAIADINDRRIFYVLAGSAGAVKLDPTNPSATAHFWTLQANVSASAPSALHATKSVKTADEAARTTPPRLQTPVVDTRSAPSPKRPSKLLAGAAKAARAASGETESTASKGLMARASAAAKKAGGY